MIRIGVILAGGEKKKRFLGKYRYECVDLPEYGISFLTVSEKQNYNKILKKNKIKRVVVLSDNVGDLNGLEVIDGKKVFEKMAPSYVRKYLKSCGVDGSVTFVDENLDSYTEEFVNLLCDICGRINLCTRCTKKAEALCDKIMERCGAVINVIKSDEPIKSDVAVIVEDFDVKFDEKCLVVGDSSFALHNKKIVDFHIPFRVKIPFDMPGIVFAQCVQIAEEKSH